MQINKKTIPFFLKKVSSILFFSFILAKIITVDKYTYFCSPEVFSFAQAYIDMLYLTLKEGRDGLVLTKEMLLKDQAVRDLNTLLIEELRLSKEENSLLKQRLERSAYDFAALQGKSDILLATSKETSWLATAFSIATLVAQAYNIVHRGDISSSDFSPEDKSVLKLILSTLVAYTTGTHPPQIFDTTLSLDTLPTRNPTT
jgi:hypothetical protein